MQSWKESAWTVSENIPVLWFLSSHETRQFASLIMHQNQKYTFELTREKIIMKYNCQFQLFHATVILK